MLRSLIAVLLHVYNSGNQLVERHHVHTLLLVLVLVLVLSSMVHLYMAYYILVCL
jgi:hypothetical protein